MRLGFIGKNISWKVFFWTEHFMESFVLDRTFHGKFFLDRTFHGKFFLGKNMSWKIFSWNEHLLDVYSTRHFRHFLWTDPAKLIVYEVKHERSTILVK